MAKHGMSTSKTEASTGSSKNTYLLRPYDIPQLSTLAEAEMAEEDIDITLIRAEIDRLEHRMEHLKEKLDARIFEANLEARLNAKLAPKLEAKLEVMVGKMDQKWEAKLEAMLKKVDEKLEAILDARLDQFTPTDDAEEESKQEEARIEPAVGKELDSRNNTTDTGAVDSGFSPCPHCNAPSENALGTPVSRNVSKKKKKKKGHSWQPAFIQVPEVETQLGLGPGSTLQNLDDDDIEHFGLFDY